jgi:hypothetical protein
MMDDLRRRASEIDEESRLAVAVQVFEAICEHAREGGSFRYLIYDRLGFYMGAYVPLQLAGALTVSNEFTLTSANADSTLLEKMRQMAEASPLQPTEIMNSKGQPIMMPTPERHLLFRAVWHIEELEKRVGQLERANTVLSQHLERLGHDAGPDLRLRPTTAGAEEVLQLELPGVTASSGSDRA